MRLVGLAGIVILGISLVVSGVTYLGTWRFEWAPRDLGFIYSFVLTVGFAASICAGLFGALKELEEFLIASGFACITLTVVNKLFINRLYSWGFLDAVVLVAGVLMIVDRFHVKRTKEIRAKELEKPKPEQLLEKFNRLTAVGLGTEPQTRIGDELYEAKRMLWQEAADKPELAKTLRGRLLQSRVAQEIVKRFIDLNLEVVTPEMETTETPAYPKLVDVEGYSQGRVQATLSELADSGILLGELYEKLIACPNCHRPSKVFVRNKCPKCSSRQIHMNRLAEHTKCGAIYRQEEYNGLKCPKCGRNLEGKMELKPVGVAFECESCKTIFSDPTQSFYCRRCSAEFELKNCELNETYSYKFNDKAKYVAREALTVATLADTVEALGYEVKVSNSLKGRTGVSHEFTLTCNRERLVALDLVMSKSEGRVNTPMVLPSYAKFMDVPTTTHLLVAIPSLETQTREFLQANQIMCVEGEKLLEISEAVAQILR